MIEIREKSISQREFILNQLIVYQTQRRISEGSKDLKSQVN